MNELNKIDNHNSLKGETTMLKFKILIAVSALMVSINMVLFSQNNNNSIEFHGNVNLSYENLSVAYGTEIDPNTLRLIVNSTLKLSKYVEIPISIFYSTNQPENMQSFNRVGISPKFFNWLTLHAGSYTTDISELTGKSITLMGTGIENRKGKFRISMLYGKINSAIRPDSTKYFQGEFKRDAYALKIGFGKKSKGFVDINILKVIDDKSSISHIPIGLYPKENAVGSLEFGFSLFKKKLRFNCEVGIAAYSNDTRVEEKKNVDLGIIKNLFTPRYSSQVDGAVSLNLVFAPNKDLSFDYRSKWIGPGYITLGNPYMQNDLFENSLTTVMNLFKGKVNLNGTIGIINDNLRDTRFTTTRRMTSSLTVTWQPSFKFGLNLQYFSYGMDSNPKNDTLKTDNAAKSFSISPNYNFNGNGN